MTDHGDAITIPREVLDDLLEEVVALKVALERLSPKAPEIAAELEGLAPNLLRGAGFSQQVPREAEEDRTG